jgi:hypothetical protein
MVQRLHLRDPWQMELASLLSQIGYLTLGMEPAPQTGDVESFEARRQQMMHPAAARDLLANIPRLERVAAMVGGQRDPYDAEDAGLPIGQRDPVKVGAQILRVAIEFDAGMCAGLSPADALSRLRLRPGQYDPLLVEALCDVSIPQVAYVPRRVTVHDLRSGMVLDQDVRNESGLLLIARGHEVTLPLLIRLKSLVTTGAIGGQLRVLARAEG